MIKILGSGLAGLSAAILLRKGGHEVIIKEKAEFIGTVVDDIQAIRNYEHDYDQLDFFSREGITLKYTKPIYSIVKYAPSGKSMTVQSENSMPIFYALKRGKEEKAVDHQLYKQALNSGVKINFNSKEDLTKTDADIISVGPLFHNIWAFGGVYEVKDVDPETILFFMNNDYCPKGYIYLVPYGRKEVTIAATTFDMKCNLAPLFFRFLKENKIVADILQDAKLLRYTSGHSYSNMPETAEINGKKVVGSSAGFLDPARGFGIKYAIWSGILAAKSIMNKVSYDELWRNAFGKDLSESIIRRIFLEKMLNEDYEKMILSDKVSIKKYEKIPSILRKKMMELKISWELGRFRKEYDLQKKLQN
ncbi:MAG: NAD(P)-binding protein [Candidatus Aenigmarchaeota archaeon]|nr:NAD(P)-binding protein [Candidatus Aenigmarchaeota archaeon]